MKEKILIVFVICFTLFACNSGKDEMKSKEVGHTLFKLLDSSQTGVSFVNAIENQKNFNIFKYRNFYNGGGVAIGDINNDGLPDIYLTGNMEANKLYLNKGNFKFEDITIKAGVAGNKPWSTGVTMADVNADGYLDIYVSNAGNLEGNNHDNDLYINNGDLTFTEKAHDFNLAKTGFSTHASFFDYDKDGDLDAYILNNSNIPVSSLGYAEQREVRAQDWEGVPHIFRGVGDMLLRNDDGKFVDVSEDAGIYGSLIGFGLGVLVTDINNDLYPDIYVSNDFYERDYLYINNQDGTFSERIKDWVSHLSLSAMGIDIADINNDGHNDIFITDMLPEPEQRVKSVMEFEGYNVFNLKQSKDFYQQYIQNTLQLNNGNGSFSEIAYYSGVDATDWSWAGLMFDMDNDGLKDIFVTNGINHDLTDLDFVDFFANEIIQKMALTGRKESIDSIIAKMPIKPQPNYAYRNNGDITFDNANADWGFELPTMSNGAAYGDLDNDGDLDLVINNVNTPAFIYENQTNSQLAENNFIKIKFNGMGKNPFGVGSLAKLYYEDNILNQELIPSRGFQSSMDYTMTIGLGKTQKLDSIRVVWPDNQTQLLTEIPVNQEIAFNQSEADAVYQAPDQNGNETLLSELDNSNLLAHKENYYSDFDYEGLIYKKISQEGPAMAIGDVNGDGHEDVFVGGAKSGERWVYFHLGNGKFDNGTKISAKSNWGDDTAAAFFDADNDGDLDLAIGISGNEVGQQQKYRTELLLNDGKGTFTDSGKVLPSTFKNISVIAPNDYDGDGDTDIFIGSRSTVGIYGINPDHLLLENRGDLEFVDATERSGYDLKDAGMVSDAIWADINGDSKEDLITISEWGTPKIYEKTGRRILKVESSLDSLSGWWNTVEAADLDNDGDLDLVLGNHGENLHYGPRYDAPMRMWINDFDNNGTIEQIVTLHENGGDYPIHQKKELTEQLVSLKKQNLKASDYARRTIHELFPKEVLDKSVVKESVVSSSVLAINEGNGNFTIKKLPPMTQLSCVCDISCTDVNGDGHLDLVMAGNDFEYKPQFSRLDANYGNVLLGNGKLDFEWQHYDKSGFFIRNEVKHLKELKDKAGNRYMIAAINNDKPKIFAINE